MVNKHRSQLKSFNARMAEKMDNKLHMLRHFSIYRFLHVVGFFFFLFFLFFFFFFFFLSFFNFFSQLSSSFLLYTGNVLKQYWFLHLATCVYQVMMHLGSLESIQEVGVAPGTHFSLSLQTSHTHHNSIYKCLKHEPIVNYRTTLK